MSEGIPGLLLPYNSSEFHAAVEKIRHHHHGIHDQITVFAADLRRVLRKVKGAPGLLGVDMKIAAWRVTKPLIAVAGHDLEAARAAIRAYQVYNELFLGKKPEAAHSRTFDVAK